MLGTSDLQRTINLICRTTSLAIKPNNASLYSSSFMTSRILCRAEGIERAAGDKILNNSFMLARNKNILSIITFLIFWNNYLGVYYNKILNFIEEATVKYFLGPLKFRSVHSSKRIVEVWLNGVIQIMAVKWRDNW